MAIHSEGINPTDDEVNTVAVHYWGPSVIYDREKLREALALIRNPEAHTPTDHERSVLLDELEAWQKHTGDAALGNLLRRVGSAIRRFEAHAPTDHEREALDWALTYARRYWQHGGESESQRALSILSSALHRSEVPEPRAMIECPHWSPGRITLRKGCTACEASSEVPEPSAASEFIDVEMGDSYAHLVGRVKARPEPQGEPSDAPTVQFVGRKGGKTQAVVAQLLAQANERGIRVEVVYPQGEPSDAQVPSPESSAYAESESMTVDTDPSADEHRDLIGFLRDNATELGITGGWSTQDRAAAREEAERRFGEWLTHPRMDRFGEGCINGFQLGAEWWKAMQPAASRPVCPKHAHIGHSAEEPCYWCSASEDNDVTDADLISWHVEQVEALRPFTRSSHHLKAAMMHAATVRALRAAGGVR